MSRHKRLAHILADREPKVRTLVGFSYIHRPVSWSDSFHEMVQGKRWLDRFLGGLVPDAATSFDELFGLVRKVDRIPMLPPGEDIQITPTRLRRHR